VETAKQNKLNPYTYLNHLFEKLPNVETRDDATLNALLPWAVQL
jgi:transposase